MDAVYRILHSVLAFSLLLSHPLPAVARGGGSGAIQAASAERYAVIFDAGSTGSRVHVYCFDDDLKLQLMGSEIELFVKVKPGLSEYADDPAEAAISLVPLLEKARSAVPEELRPSTPVRLGATAGLRLLGTEKANQILEAVRDLLRENSSLEYEADWVTVLSGYQEGYYIWVTVNYLLGKLGNKYPETAAVVDLGGGSVQMAYAISEEAASKAPASSSDDEPYVKELYLQGTKYYSYVHSYLNYGLMASRAEILKVGAKSYSYCILGGYNGVYSYSGTEYKASASPSGASFGKCRSEVIEALKVGAPCDHPKCTFGGIWNGGGGAGQKNLYATSYFFDRLSDVGVVDAAAPSVQAKPSDIMKAAKGACKATMESAKAKYPNVFEKDLPYVCMDLVYEYTLLVDGFGLKPRQNITLVQRLLYGDSGAYGETAWPLGSAIEVVASEKSTTR